MKARLIYLRFRVERRLAAIPYRRVGAVPFFLAGGIACLSSGLDLLWAPLPKCFLALFIGVAYIFIGALLWGLD